jgi:hypothetical protein
MVCEQQTAAAGHLPGDSGMAYAGRAAGKACTCRTWLSDPRLEPAATVKVAQVLTIIKDEEHQIFKQQQLLLLDTAPAAAIQCDCGETI